VRGKAKEVGGKNFEKRVAIPCLLLVASYLWAAIPCLFRLAFCLSKAMISFRHVSYSVPDEEGGERLLLADASFELARGATSCVIGTSGSGKTTLLRLMAGLLRPDEGEILIDGKNIARLSERELNVVRREMGFVFQYSALFDSMNVGDNVGFGLERQHKPRREIEAAVRELLAEVGLQDQEKKNPSQLSGGMKKRVAMARALATSPQIVLYDEPDSGLDPVMTRIIDDLIIRLRDSKGITNVVVTHNVDSIRRISDYVLMIHQGILIAAGTLAEVEALPSPVVQQFLMGDARGPIVL